MSSPPVSPVSSPTRKKKGTSTNTGTPQPPPPSSGKKKKQSYSLANAINKPVSEMTQYEKDNIIMSKKMKEYMEKLYYEDGYTLGKDTLFSVLEAKQQEAKEKGKKLEIPTRIQLQHWLNSQELQQRFRGTRKGGEVGEFKATDPLRSLSADLLDFQNKPARQFRYVLVVVDNFSRYMWTRPMTGKTAEKTAKGMDSILDEVEKKRATILPDADSGYILSDDGPEFKSDYIQLLKKKNWKKIRTLGGQPQSNGLVERANGKLKMVLRKNQTVKGGTWVDHLANATNVYNTYKNRSIGFTPKQALNLPKSKWKEVRANVRKTQKSSQGAYQHAEKVEFNVGDSVRIKITKGKLSKGSDASWSTKLYKIKKIYKGSTPSIREKFQIEGQDEDKRYSVYDILKVNPDDIEPIPTEYKIKRKKKKSSGEIPTGKLVPDIGEPDAEGRSKRNVKRVDYSESTKKKAARTDTKTKTKTKEPKKYEVEKILAKRGKDKNTEFKVRWKGYSAKDDSWEPIQNLKNLDVLKKYIKQERKD